VAQTLASHNLPTNRAKELIKPSTDSASLQLTIEKKFFFVLDFGFFVYYVTMRASLCIFGQLCLALGASPMRTLFRSMFFGFVTRKRVFRDLLAHQETKLRLQNPVFSKNLKFSKKVTLATSVQLWPLVVGSQIELGSYLNPLKTREVFYIR